MEANVIVCYSRCLYCGRRTPHEVCHGHSEALNPGWWDQLEAGYSDTDVLLEDLWRIGFGLEPETCEDGACPAWGPGEWGHKQTWATMTHEKRLAEIESIKQGIAERRAARRSE